MTSRSVAVFSGGSGANAIVEVFKAITEKQKCALTYIIPISDNGGSTSEVIRVLGGPSIGDVRSRLVRLIPPTHSNIHALLNHRLAPSPVEALFDWQSIVSGTSPLWPPIPSPARELLRSFINLVNLEILKRARPPHSTFNFSSASIGNLFLTGARLFTGSFESAIYLLALICGITEETSVIPAINTNFSHHISAGLANGDILTGQNAISHPSAPTSLPDQLSSDSYGSDPLEEEGPPEDANLPGSLPGLRTPNIFFSKAEDDDIASRISRIWYINPYGQEICPQANPKVLSALKNAEAIIYSIGSLYTSILPCIIPKGVGEAIESSPKAKHKILILNGSLDRETGPKSNPMDAVDFVASIARAGEESKGWRAADASADARSLIDPAIWKKYVSHVIFLEEVGAPAVDKKLLSIAGIECVKCWGRKRDDGTWVYDDKGLVMSLEAILGRVKCGERSRRNTIDR